MFKCLQFQLFLILSITSANLAAQSAIDNMVVAERGNVKLTFSDIDVVMEKVPSGDRSAVVAGADRLQHILDSELLNKQLAQRGREMKLMDSPMIRKLVARHAEQAFAMIVVEKILEGAKKPNFDALAKEYYIANKDEFTTPVTSVVKHILISKQGRSAAETQTRIKEVQARLQVDGADFDALVKEYSDDPSKLENNGLMTVAAPGQFVAEFELAAHALKKVSDVSSPVETEFGTHILRLDSRIAGGTKPYESVHDEIASKLAAEYVDGIRTKLLSDLRAANPVFHENAISELRKRYGELPKIGSQPVVPTAPAVDGAK